MGDYYRKCGSHKCNDFGGRENHDICAPGIRLGARKKSYPNLAPRFSSVNYFMADHILCECFDSLFGRTLRISVYVVNKRVEAREYAVGIFLINVKYTVLS